MRPRAPRCARVLLAAMLACAAGTRAAEPAVVSCSEWPPYVIPTPEPSGLLVDHVRTLLADAGFDAQVVVYPWRRVIAAARQGEIDLVFCAEGGQESAYELDYIGPVLESTTVIVSDPEHPIDTLARPGLSIAVGAGYWYGEEFERLRAQLDVTSVRDDLQILRMIAYRRVTAGLIEQRVLGHLLRTHPELDGRIHMAPEPYEIQRFYLAAARNTRVDVERLRRHFGESGDLMLHRER